MGLDEISYKLGELMSKIESGNSARSELAQQIAALRQELSTHCSEEMEMFSKLSGVCLLAEETKKTVDEHEKFKNRALIAITAAGTGGGSVGSILVHYAKSFLGGHT